jgi:hypothetical protein
VEEHKRTEEHNEEMLGQNFKDVGKQRSVVSGLGKKKQQENDSWSENGGKAVKFGRPSTASMMP